MVIRAICLLLVTGAAIGCTKVSPPQNSLSSAAQGELRPSQFVAAAIKVLEENRRLGSLVYRGHCTDSGGMTDSFRVSSPGHAVSPIEALRQAFANDPTLTVKEDSSGMIRVVGGDVQPELLGVKIHNLKFQEESDPRVAAYKVLASPELKAHMEEHRSKFVVNSGGLVPTPSGRHLNVTLTDITISQSLDRIALTFPGVWIYEECVMDQGEKRVDIRFHEFPALTSTVM